MIATRQNATLLAPLGSRQSGDIQMELASWKRRALKKEKR
jgi:hypothetical protein